MDSDLEEKKVPVKVGIKRKSGALTPRLAKRIKTSEIENKEDPIKEEKRGRSNNQSSS